MLGLETEDTHVVYTATLRPRLTSAAVVFEEPTNITSRPTLSVLRDKTPVRYLFDKNYRVSLSTKGEWVKGKVHLPCDGEDIFTDGSKEKENAAAAVYRRINRTSSTIPMGFYATVPQSETTGLL